MLMDSQEAEVETEVEVEVEAEFGRTKRRGVASAVLRCTLGLVFPFILVFFTLWFYVALSSSSSSTDSDSTISLPSQCRLYPAVSIYYYYYYYFWLGYMIWKFILSNMNILNILKVWILGRLRCVNLDC